MLLSAGPRPILNRLVSGLITFVCASGCFENNRGCPVTLLVAIAHLERIAIAVSARRVLLMGWLGKRRHRVDLLTRLFEVGRGCRFRAGVVTSQ